MKKISVLFAFFCLLFASSVIFAQDKAANFAGNWELDVAKSKLPERMRVESMTMSVTQTDKELKVQTTAKRAAPPEGQASTGGNGGGFRPDGNRTGNRGGMGGGNSLLSYTLDGNETTITPETRDGMPAAAILVKAKIEKGGKLQLVSNRSFNTPNGSMSIKTTENWELSNGGKTLKVTRDVESQRGTQSSEMYFTKKDSIGGSSMTVGSDANSSAGAMSGTGDTSDETSKVLNGKALKLTLPKYPAEARQSKASGAVKVQVVIDEKGNVVSASAVSGDSLLKAASEEAARNTKFSPTVLGGIPVKVTGVIVYNFVAP